MPEKSPFLRDGLERTRLRAGATARRATLDLPTLSAEITGRIAVMPEFLAARIVLLYLALPGEVNVEALATVNDRTFLAPRCASEGRLTLHRYVPGVTPLVRGPFGIREPDPAGAPEAEASSVDLVIVPALLLSEQGDRLGYGGGYYDRLLPTLRPDCVRLGALPEALIVPMLPVQPWDMPVQIVVTEARIRRPEGRMLTTP